MQSIALEILYRNVSLRLDLRSTFKAAEVTKGQWPYCKLVDSRQYFSNEHSYSKDVFPVVFLL